MSDHQVHIERLQLPSRLHRPATPRPSPALVDALLQLLSPTDAPGSAIQPTATTAEKATTPAVDNSEPQRTRRDSTRATTPPTAGSNPNVGRDKNLADKLRGLNSAEQQKLARRGDLTERKLLERSFGKSVWEALLKNPKVTPPEVATMARKGSLPIPLLELIVNNRAWLSAPTVRRALLTNPRLRRNHIVQVLSATPRPELKLMVKQTAYPSVVREAAARLLR